MIKHLAFGALLASGLAAWAAPARAGETHRLNLPADTRPLVLDSQSEADTLDATWRFRGGYGGGYGYGYRGAYVGYGYRGPGWGGWGGGGGWGGYYHRPYYASSFYYQRPFYGYGYGGGFYGNGFNGYGNGFYGNGYGYGGSFYYPRVYSYSHFSYSYPVSYGAPAVVCSDRPYVPVMPPAAAVAPLPPGAVVPGSPAPAAPAPERGDPPAPPMPLPGAEGTFPYDGGPRSPAPVPRVDPLEGVPSSTRMVSLNVSGGRWVYPAYGEAPRRAVPAATPAGLTGFAAPTYLMSSN